MRKDNVAVIISLVSIALAIIILTIFIVNTSNGIGNKFTLEGYIGIMAGFMGACATIIVGIQIYNSIEIKNERKERTKELSNMRIDFEKAKHAVESIEHKLEYEVNHSQEIIDQTKDFMDAKVNIVGAISISARQPITAFCCFHKSLIIFFNQSSWKDIDVTLGNMETVVGTFRERLNKLYTENHNLNKNVKDEFEVLSPKDWDKFQTLDYTSTLEKFPSSKLIHERYDKLYENAKNIFQYFIKERKLILHETGNPKMQQTPECKF